MRKRRFLSSWAILAVGMGLVGCNQAEEVSTPRAARTAPPAAKRDFIPPAVLEVYMDLRTVQDFEHGRFALYQRQRRHDSINFNRGGRAIRFPTVRAYRAHLRQRMDSLAAHGETFTDVDTAYTAHERVYHSPGTPPPPTRP